MAEGKMPQWFAVSACSGQVLATVRPEQIDALVYLGDGSGRGVIYLRSGTKVTVPGGALCALDNAIGTYDICEDVFEE